MPGMPGPTTDERDNLLAYIDQQIYLVKIAVHGLSEDQAREHPSASSLTLGGLVKHLAWTTRTWIARLTQRSYDGPEFLDTFVMTGDDRLEALVADLEAAAGELRAAVADLDMGHEVPAGKAPWMPDMDAFTVRWILAHLIDETARHLGHADVIRESLDGALAPSLMAAVEHWPANPWVTPWTPPSG